MTKNIPKNVNIIEEKKTIIEKIVEIDFNNKKYLINYKDLSNRKVLMLDDNIDIDKAYYDLIKIEGSNYYIYNKKNKLYLTSALNKVLNRKANLHVFITKKNVIFYGKYSNIERKYPNNENVLLNNQLVTQIIRPFKNKYLKNFAIIKINNELILKSGEIHNDVYIGKDIDKSLPIKLRKKKTGIVCFAKKRLQKQLILIRSTMSSASVRITVMPMQKEYNTYYLIKNYIAYLLSNIIGPRNIVLMFEKETNKANESGYYVFDKISHTKNVKSKVFFVIDKNSPDFSKVYNSHPKSTIKKYSFKHYLYIYISKYFISSELSNHVINPRIYIRTINNAIKNKPLIFLQHGIMFAKPVDNPAAAGFQKSNEAVNFYKCIISSDLEATQFYKLGFSDDDLIKCGLTKFDISKQNEDAGKIMFMPTYRYWEEALVMNPDTIKDTTYYKNYMSVINKFKEAGLIDKLIISCHPKFADCLINADPLYSDIIEKDINKGLENAKIFITDYSSASYDAHYRGSYIIYYWVEKDYLIENYHAIPPVDETNCDGVPVYNVDDLIKEVKKAISQKYKMDKKYEDRYKKINEFHDGKNGDRLIEELKKLNII